MRAELFSLRRTPDEVAELNNQSKSLYTRLDEITNTHIIINTEVDRNPKRICNAFRESVQADDGIEGYIFANAIDTEDSSSFVELFTPVMSLIEDAQQCSISYKENDETLENHVNVYAFNCKGTKIKGYCFYALNKRFIALPAFETVEGIDFVEFFTDAVLSAKSVLKKKKEKYPTGIITLNKDKINYYKPKKVKRNYFMSFIPCKGDSIGDVIRKLIVLIAIAGFIAGAVILLNFYVFMPMGNQTVIDEIQQVFYATQDEVVYATNDEGEVVEVKTTVKNWKGLKKINKEIVAWVKIDGTKIDYPVLQHKGDNADSQFYLYRNYKQDYSDFGSIFVDYRCEEEGIDSKNFILHGHNMGSDDSMFGQLINYARTSGSTKGNVDFYKKAPIVTIDTPDGTEEYVIFSLMKIDVSNDLENVFDYLKTDFDSTARFMNFVYNIKIRSYLDVDVPINENDQLLTLSTCSYETDNMRTIAVARKLRDSNEDLSKYIKKAKPASPVSIASSTFRTEYSAGNTPWYDGNGKVKGDESVIYMKQSEMYTVEFLDAKGKAMSTQIIIKGKDAKAPKEPPRKAAEGRYYFVFKGWDTDFTNVTKDLTVKPVFTKKKMPVETKPTTEPTTAKPTEAPEVIPDTEPPVVTEAPETKPPKTEAPTTAAPTTAPPTEATTATEALTTATPTTVTDAPETQPITETVLSEPSA
ncbi:MAG: class B sortase [Clostridia bacterium]|nr:class B sortase [Clostridia bacterium]